MDPLSISASLLAILTACIQTTKSLSSAVNRYKGRDKTLHRLDGGLKDLIVTLELLKKIKIAEGISRMLIEGPVSRCEQICKEFESSMEKFNNKSKLGFLDWTKMEFMTGDINGFMDTLAAYKATIAIGLGIINMQSSKVTEKVVEEYTELVKDTVYDLKLHLQRIEDKISQGAESLADADIVYELNSEKDVTEHCLQICHEAKNYIESVQKRENFRLEQRKSTAQYVEDQFEARVMTNRVLEKNQNELASTIESLQKSLAAMTSLKGEERTKARKELFEDIEVSKQCLEVCERASEQVNRVKIHTIGPVIAEHNTDQVVVTTLADLFNIDRVEAKSGSAQLVGSFNDDSLKQLSSDRYNSRFGIANGSVEFVDIKNGSTESAIPQTPKQDTKQQKPSDDGRDSRKTPSANEMRRRRTGSD